MKVKTMKSITQKPNILYRLISRKIVEIGYIQKCKGYVKRNSMKFAHVIYFTGKTEIETNENLKKAVSAAFKDGFRPKKYLAIQKITSVNYVPFWQKEFWQFKNTKKYEE